MITKSLILSTLFLPLGSPVFAKTYSVEHDVIFRSYQDAKACEADGYKWEGDEQDGYCVAQGADSVSIKRISRKRFKVNVETITTNAHMCSYEAYNGHFKSPTRLVSWVPATIYDENGKATATRCVVTVIYNQNKTVSVTTNGNDNCAGFCGANAFLNIEGATSK